MVVAEHENIEVDYCIDCHGVWFDAGELDLLLESMGLEEPDLSTEVVMSAPSHSTEEKPKSCPACNARMKKVGIGADPELVIDVCTHRDGIWFDGGELASIMKQVSEASPEKQTPRPKAISFLADLFKAELKHE
jgi:Zn-finger nucleic acid-binding protein